MKLGFILKLYLISLFIFLAIDSIWIGLVAQGFYQKELGFLLSKQPNLVAGLLFYLIYVLALLYFVTIPSLKGGKKLPTLNTAMAGGFFGIAAYATYDLTNYSTIAHWPLLLTIVDMIWGMVLSSLVATLGFLIGKKLS